MAAPGLSDASNPAQLRSKAVPPRSSAVLREIGTWLFFFLLIILLQWVARAYSSEFAHFEDEGAHYVTGLLVRDYLATDLLRNPVPFAEHFYSRFPKVAFGLWPPLFHVIEGIWLLPTPDGRVSVLLLMASIMASTAYLLCRLVRKLYAWPAGLITGCLLILNPLARQMSQTVMIDSMVMFAVLGFAVATAKWLETGSRRDAVWVGILAGLAMMSKGNGMMVALALPLAILLSSRFELFRSGGLYIAAAIAGVMGFAVESVSLSLFRRISSFHPFTLGGIENTAYYCTLFLHQSFGWVIDFLVVLGVALVVPILARRRRGWNVWASMGATALAVIAFHVVLPQPFAARYLLPAIGPLLMFVVPAATRLQEAIRLPRIPLILLGLLAFNAAFSVAQPPLPHYGFREAAAWIRQHPLPGLRYMVISDSNGEGAFISELASGVDRRLPLPAIMRSSKFFFVSDWNGHNYRMVYNSPEQALGDIKQMGISYILMDNDSTFSEAPHWSQIRAMLRDTADLRPVAHFPAAPGVRTRSLDVYQVLHYENPPSKPFTFQLFFTVGESLTGDIH